MFPNLAPDVIQGSEAEHGLSAHEQETGLVLADKEQRSAACTPTCPCFPQNDTGELRDGFKMPPATDPSVPKEGINRDVGLPVNFELENFLVPKIERDLIQHAYLISI